ncbi:MAG: helix-turn-helix domain-containing protein, partial [Patescibacteria group bacterium]|nr:helix-turn-helix domain-containing protein [Patescibacteria group bacterium]
MKTIGEILKNARVSRKLTLTDLSRLTKISLTTLKALEKNQFNKLPSTTYIQGFIKNYTQALRLDPAKTLAVFKRDYDRHHAKKILPQGLIQPLNQSFLTSVFGRNLIAASIILLILAGYLIFMIIKLYRPPQLIIDQPQEAQEVASPILIKGKTDRDANLTLNNQTVNLEPDGQFTTVYSTQSGALELKFNATSRRGKSQELVR